MPFTNPLPLLRLSFEEVVRKGYTIPSDVDGLREYFWIGPPGFGWVSEDEKRAYKVYEGNATDFASFPEYLPFGTTLLGDPHEVAEAAVIHDILYVNATLHKYNRKESDQIFREILLEIGVPKWRARLMYWGVRVGGAKAWNRHARSNADC